MSLLNILMLAVKSLQARKACMIFLFSFFPLYLISLWQYTVLLFSTLCLIFFCPMPDGGLCTLCSRRRSDSSPLSPAPRMCAGTIPGCLTDLYRFFQRPSRLPKIDINVSVSVPLGILVIYCLLLLILRYPFSLTTL